MRIPALTALAFGTLLATPNAQAQTYDPNYPVCLHVYGKISYYECGYASIPQCNLSASGRSAQCVVNPYYAEARGPGTSPLSAESPSRLLSEHARSGFDNACGGNAAVDGGNAGADV